MANVSATTFTSFPWATSSRPDECACPQLTRPARFLGSRSADATAPAPVPVLLDPLLLLDIGPRGCASPPKRSLGSFFHFIFPAIVKRGRNLVLAARLSHVAALQAFQHDLPFLFGSSLNFRLSHSRLLAEAPSLTNFCVQF